MSAYVTTNDGACHEVAHAQPAELSEGDTIVVPTDDDGFFLGTITHAAAGAFFQLGGYEERGMLHITGPTLVVVGTP